MKQDTEQNTEYGSMPPYIRKLILLGSSAVLVAALLFCVFSFMKDTHREENTGAEDIRMAAELPSAQTQQIYAATTADATPDPTEKTNRPAIVADSVQTVPCLRRTEPRRRNG